MPDRKLLVAYFQDPQEFLRAAEQARRAGLKNLDALMPYPVHGFEQALGLKKSWLPSAAKAMMLVGVVGGFALQAWTSAVDWPLNVGGKPLISWPAFVPIIFESGVLLAGLTTFFALLHVTRMYPFKNPKLPNLRVTDDRFALVVPVEGNGDLQRIRDTLSQMGVNGVDEATA